MNDEQQEARLRTQLNGETARFRWKQLQRFFAAGSVVAVGDGLDLVDVAVKFALDDSAAVRAWMAARMLGPVSDEQAGAWLEQDAELWTVVVKPWILVQYGKPEQRACDASLH